MSSACGQQQRFSASELIGLASHLLTSAGLASDRADDVAEILVEGDLMGHTTHGLQLLPSYLDVLERGLMARSGEPTTVSDRGSAVTWDGGWLPGPWLMLRALDLAFERIASHPVVTIVIRRAGHIGCLAAYPRRATERRLMMLLSCSDPSLAVVAPHGAVEGRLTPNPIAAGWPTEGDPVIIDVSPSSTTVGMVGRAKRSGQPLQGAWLIDAHGEPSSDPNGYFADPPAPILPLGGVDLGHKGYALGLLVEALSSALAGGGRSGPTDHWGAAVFLQVIDPSAFGGRTPFERETTWLAKSCEAARPWPGSPAVRLPGRRGLALRREQLASGVALHRDILPALQPWCDKLNVNMIGEMPQQR